MASVTTGIELPASPVSAAEVAPVRQPVDEAHLLPPRVFHDPDVFAFEQERWFARTWVCVGREEDVAEPGTYLLVRVAGESVAVVRDRAGFGQRVPQRLPPPRVDAARRARRRCTAARSCASSARTTPGSTTSTVRCSAPRTPRTSSDFALEDQGLIPVRLETWAGFVFVNLDPAAEPLLAYLDDLPAAVAQLPDRRPSPREADRVRGRRQLEGHRRELLRVLPLPRRPSAAQPAQPVRPRLEPRVARAVGGRLDGAASTTPTRCPTDGLRMVGRRSPGIGDENERRVYYIVVWPNLLLSLHPDYVMSPPGVADRRRAVARRLRVAFRSRHDGRSRLRSVRCGRLLGPDQPPGLGRVRAPAGGHALARLYVPGRYSLMEDMVHAFDLMAADGYAEDGVTTRFAPRHDKWAPEPRRRAG